jgi:membrane protein YdbS with pleckstrin-like domain
VSTPGEATPESVVARLRPHARALFWPSLALVADVGATAFFAGTLRPDWLNLVLLAVSALLAVLLFVAPLMSWLNRSYTITTRRIILRHGVLARTRQELLHSRGYDVTVHQAGLQLLFGSGDVLINTGLENPIVLRDIPSADLVQSALHDLMEKSLNPIAARRQREQSRRREWDDSADWDWEPDE